MEKYEIGRSDTCEGRRRRKGDVGGERVESFTGDYYGRIAKRCTATRARSAVEYIIFLNHGYARSGVTYENTHRRVHASRARMYVLISCTSCMHVYAYSRVGTCRTSRSVNTRAITRSLVHAHVRTRAACKRRITRSLRVQDDSGKPWSSSSPTWRLMK